MSAPVFLLNHSVGVPVSIKDSGPELEDTYLAVANHQIPLLWLALFTESNVTTVLIAYAEDANGEWLKRPGPTVFVNRKDGLETYARRKEAIRNTLGAALSRYIDDWERMLASQFVQGTHFQIEFSEVAEMYNENEFEPALLSWLKGLEELSGPGWEDLCNQANLNDPKSAVVNFGMRGDTHHGELGWGE